VSRLPQRGDAVRAAEALNARVNAAVGGSEDRPLVVTGETHINMRDGSLSGEGAESYRRVYGDLMDVAEVTGACGLSLAEHHMPSILATGDPLPLILQCVAFGVLMERLRWERGS
jgi:hypothetical protein